MTLAALALDLALMAMLEGRLNVWKCRGVCLRWWIVTDVMGHHWRRELAFTKDAIIFPVLCSSD